MTKFTEKLDRKLLKACSIIMLPRVRKAKGRQNKFHFFIKIIKTNCIILAICFLGIGPLGWRMIGEPMWFVAILIAMWGGIIILEMKKMYDFEEVALLYHIAIFTNKNAKQLKIFKEGIEAQFNNSRKHRIFFVYAVLAWFCLVVFLESVFIVIGERSILLTIAHLGILYLQYRFIISRYIYYIDDLTPPKSRKRARQSITDLVKKTWENLIKNPLPSPSPA